jgi:hypothetical protein
VADFSGDAVDPSLAQGTFLGILGKYGGHGKHRKQQGHGFSFHRRSLQGFLTIYLRPKFTKQQYSLPPIAIGIEL